MTVKCSTNLGKPKTKPKPSHRSYRPKVIEVLMEVVVNRAVTVNSLDLAECRGLTEQRLD